MPFTTQEIENIANSALDFYFDRPKVRAQSLQDKPLLRALNAKKKTFPGGKEYISGAVKGTYTTTIQGFSHDDEVTYSNPANTKRWQVPWKMIHGGITFSMHELLKDGISVVDSTEGATVTKHDDREKTVLAGILEEKLDDMAEGIERGFNDMYWRNGTQDSTLIPGIPYFVVDNPTAGTVVAGIDQSSNTWWRNRANLAIPHSTPGDQSAVQVLQNEFRQLRRYGGRPNVALCGSDWLDWFEKELRAKGNYTDTGWAGKGKIDASVSDVAFKGVEFEYDPTLDDLSKADYCYILDTKHIYPMVIQGEDMKKHTPARPEDKYVFYRAVTYAGGLACDMRNCHGVYALA
jgi:hypothetical protein